MQFINDYDASIQEEFKILLYKISLNKMIVYILILYIGYIGDGLT